MPSPQPTPPSGAAQPSRSQTLLVALSRLPRIVVLLIFIAVVVGGLALPGVVGAVLLVLVGGALAWLLSLAWPVLSPSGRGLRVLTVALVLGYSAWKATH